MVRKRDIRANIQKFRKGYIASITEVDFFKTKGEAMEAIKRKKRRKK